MQIQTRQRRRKSQRNIGMADMMTGMMDQLSNMYTPSMNMAQDMMNSWMDITQNMMGSWMDIIQPTRRPMVQHYRRHGHCQDCDCDDDCDTCVCKVCNADVVIYGRVAEIRFVPLVIENNRHRERQIKVELSDFVKSDNKDVKLLEAAVIPSEFTLASCQEQELVLAVRMVPTDLEGAAGIGTLASLREQATKVPIKVPDVDSCTQYHADLRVEGCDMSPLRIAVVLLPRDCDPIDIDCSCGCC